MESKAILKKISQWFFPFWVNNWRVSILLTFLIVVLWGLSLNNIPKESSPKIEFGIISVTTIYPWVWPVDIDTLLTAEVEKALEDVDGIRKVTSSSSVWFWNTTIELENWVEASQVMIDIKDEVEKINFPEDAEDPIFTEISSDDQGIFELIIYGEQTLFPKERLIEAASTIKNSLEGKGWITDIDIQWTDEFDLEILVDKEKAESIWITLGQIANAIRAHNRNIPLWQYEVDEFNYDFRIQGELSSEEELLTIPISTQDYAVLTVWDIASVIRSYKNDAIRQIWLYQSSGNNAISLSFQKRDGYNIFAASKDAKAWIEDLMQTQEFAGIDYVYAQDLSEVIKDDYKELTNSGLITIVCVLICLFLFVWFKEWFIATLGIVLAFFVTFTVLDTIWSSLNFLTNFSLVLTLWIAIDTSIVVIEAAYEKLKQWYTPKTSVILAVRDFKKPLIAWTMTTIVVFIPMMILPGITGKFLAYIPTTIFITLVAALFISLTINWALFYIFSKNKKWYLENEQAEKFLSEEDKVLLYKEREGKEARHESSLSMKQRVLEWMNSRYENFLRGYLAKRKTRIWSIIIPFALTVLSLMVLSPKIWFSLFPDGDNWRFDISVSWQAWITDEKMFERAPYIQPILSEYKEIDHYTLSVQGNKLSLWVELIDQKERKKAWLLNVFELEKEINSRLAFLQQEWLAVESLALRWWPPQAKPVALKLTTEDNNKFTELLETAKLVKEYMRWVEWLKNVSVSSKDTPGQFVYTFKDDALRTLWLTPSDLQWDIAFAINWLNAWSIKYVYNDAAIKVLYEEFSEIVSPTDILWLIIQTRVWPVKTGDVLDYTVENAVAQITRENWKVTVTVDADLEDWFRSKWPAIQTQVTKRATENQLPEWVSFEAGGEWQENAELISATIRGFLIAFFLIFAILLLQFNSFRKPIAIMYSVLCAFLWVNIWLYLTGNPYSMPFAIWFIALTWIVVNDAIVFVDRIITNNSHDIDPKEAIIEAWRSRLQPIILTTLTTLLGVLPLALQDEFWAWLWFTIIFWLFAGSAMTLFVIPSLYYELITEKKLTWFKVLFRLILLLPYWIYLFIKRVRFWAIELK